MVLWSNKAFTGLSRALNSGYICTWHTNNPIHILHFYLDGTIVINFKEEKITYLKPFYGAVQVGLDKVEELASKTLAPLLATQKSEIYADDNTSNDQPITKEEWVALGTSANIAISFIDRGMARGNEGDLSGALEDFNQAIRLNPQDAQGYYYRGYTYYKLEDYHFAVNDFSTSIAIAPFVENYFYRALAYSSLALDEYVLQDLNQAIAVNSETAKSYGVYACRAQYYQNKGKYKEAISDWNIAILNEPNSPKLYYQRALAKQSIGDKKGALNDIQKIKELDPYFLK